RCVREAEVDPDVLTVEYREARVQLRARVLDAAEVVPERLGQPQRAGEAALNERVLRPLVEVGEVEPDAAIEEADLEAGFPLRRLFGLEIRIPGGRERDARLIVATRGDHHRVVERQRVAEARSEPRSAPRRTNPQSVQPARAREPLFLTDDPGQAGRGVENEPEIRTEGAVVVAADAESEEDAVAPGELLLQVRADRAD